jgi:DNA repair protein RadC
MQLVNENTLEAETQIINKAKEILTKRMNICSVTFQNSTDTEDFLALDLALEEREVFGVLYLNSTHQLIEYKRMSVGTVDKVEVYPREIIKSALALNSSALILCHNHPSGNPEPSDADRTVTDKIIAAAKLLNIRILDHIIIGKNESVSFAARGWI